MFCDLETGVAGRSLQSRICSLGFGTERRGEEWKAPSVHSAERGILCPTTYSQSVACLRWVFTASDSQEPLSLLGHDFLLDEKCFFVVAVFI